MADGTKLWQSYFKLILNSVQFMVVFEKGWMFFNFPLQVSRNIRHVALQSYAAGRLIIHNYGVNHIKSSHTVTTQTIYPATRL